MNNYNYKKCDVCHEFFEDSKNEIVLCFGCGHQSHKSCCYKRKLKKDELSSFEDDNYNPECIICYQNEIENVENEEKNEEKKVQEQDLIMEDLNEIKKNKKNKEKGKKFKFGNKTDKFKRMSRYDKIYEDEKSMLY